MIPTAPPPPTGDAAADAGPRPTELALECLLGPDEDEEEEDDEGDSDEAELDGEEAGVEEDGAAIATAPAANDAEEGATAA